MLLNIRNAYQNYNVAVNLSEKVIYTYMGVLQPKMGNATYCSAGHLSPLLNDPVYKRIGIGTRIFRYKFDWVIQYFNVFYVLLPPGLYAGGTLEGGRCYTLLHYANEMEAAICNVPEGTPKDAFCNEYEGSYPVHSILDHLPTQYGGDGGFAQDCYSPDVPTLFILGGHTTVDPATGQTIQGPHVDDPEGSGIGLAEISESINFNNMPDYYHRPGQILPYRRGVLKWWFGNDAPGYDRDIPELSNV